MWNGLLINFNLIKNSTHCPCFSCFAMVCGLQLHLRTTPFKQVFEVIQGEGMGSSCSLILEKNYKVCFNILKSPR